MEVQQLLKALVQTKGSDLHIKVGVPPGIRIDGTIKRIQGWNTLKPDDTRRLMEQILSTDQLATFDKEGDLDFGYSLPGVARFRVNCLHQRNSCGMVVRVIPMKVLTLEDINAPEILKELSSLPRGLVLVTGPTGSGKSTTLAAMIDYINTNHLGHILTLEDPIEFIHNDKRCFVNQREVGNDTPTFAEGLRRALRWERRGRHGRHCRGYGHDRAPRRCRGPGPGHAGAGAAYPGATRPAWRQGPATHPGALFSGAGSDTICRGVSQTLRRFPRLKIPLEKCLLHV